tara:strand:- start:333 stop:479 length:147 start_codon:yes stop_codon:yes gene_type:complete
MGNSIKTHINLVGSSVPGRKRKFAGKASKGGRVAVSTKKSRDTVRSSR